MLHDALAVYYFPGMWTWARSVVEPLVERSFRDAGFAHSAFDFVRAYARWAEAIDGFTPLRVETDVEVHIPDAAQPGAELAAPDGGPVLYRIASTCLWRNRRTRANRSGSSIIGSWTRRAGHGHSPTSSRSMSGQCWPVGRGSTPTSDDPDVWRNHVADEFVVTRTRQHPTDKAARMAFMETQRAINAETFVAEVVYLKFWVLGDAAVMRADHAMPGNRRPPYRATRLWVKRDGHWQMAISQQTTIQP